MRVRAVSLNYRDLMIAWGNYPIPSDPPPIAVADGAGEVVAVDPQVTRFKAGDHVATPTTPIGLMASRRPKVPIGCPVPPLTACWLKK